MESVEIKPDRDFDDLAGAVIVEIGEVSGVRGDFAIRYLPVGATSSHLLVMTFQDLGLVDLKSFPPVS